MNAGRDLVYEFNNSAIFTDPDKQTGEFTPMQKNFWNMGMGSIKAFIDHGVYDASLQQYYIAGQLLRNLVWQDREDKKQKNCLNAMTNARVTEGKKRHVGSAVVDRHFPNRRWDKVADVVFIG